MSNYRIKHDVLKLFYDQREESGLWEFDCDALDVVKACLTPELINKAFKLEYQEIEVILHSLKKEKHIQEYTDPNVDPHGIEMYHIITIEGKTAFKEKFYLKKMWHRTPQMWFNIITILIAILALVVSIVKD